MNTERTLEFVTLQTQADDSQVKLENSNQQGDHLVEQDNSNELGNPQLLNTLDPQLSDMLQDPQLLDAWEADDSNGPVEPENAQVKVENLQENAESRSRKRKGRYIKKEITNV